MVYSTEVTDLAALDADEVIVATGAKAKTLPLKGGERAMDAVDYLLGKEMCIRDRPNTVVDVTDTFEQKFAAMALHRTQLNAEMLGLYRVYFTMQDVYKRQVTVPSRAAMIFAHIP